MNKDYLKLEEELLLTKSKAKMIQMYIELLKRIDEVIEIIEKMASSSGYVDGLTYYYESPVFQARANVLLKKLKGNNYEKENKEIDT